MDTVAYETLTGNKLTDSRDNWKTLCPVHMERTPSFFIHKETYLSHCFGCGVKGTLDFILARAYEKNMFDIRTLLGMPKQSTLLTMEKKEVEEKVFPKVKLAGFHRITNHPLLEERGFSSDTVVDFNARWDPDRKRIVFPLTNVGNSLVVGAVGRTVKKNDAKWYFYWDTQIGEILHQPLTVDTKLDIIVEGIFDQMWLHQHGFRSSGALIRAIATQTQINLIKDNTDEVILFLDNDEAGRIGTRKLAEKLKSSVKVTVAKYPDGKKDPQELTEDELHTAIRDRLTLVQYYSH